MSSDDDSNQYQRDKFISERFETEGDNADEADAFMPALPPHLLKKKADDVKDNIEKKLVEIDSKTEELDDCVYGPVLPQHLSKKPEPDLNESSESLYGPKIPDSIKPKPIIGPAIPEHFLKASQNEEIVEEEEEEEEEKNDSDVDDSLQDEDEFFGPSPSLMAKEGSVNYSKMFTRKEKKEEKETAANQRESWMLELPSDKAANLGLGPRTFRTRLPDKGGDRSEWTDTPADKERKRKNPEVKDDSSLVRQKCIEERDKEMEKLARKAEKKLKRDETLLEIHMKKMKKKAKKEAKKREKEGKPVERRPFNRETDLQVNRFDESQKRAVLKKAQLLNDRFSQGESKFL